MSTQTTPTAKGASLRQGWLANLKLRPWMLKWGMNLWSPLRGAKIRLETVSADFRYARVAMPLKLTNRNMWGVHFGGSLFAMTDALYGIMLKQALGNQYVVWDKSATIHFRKPGRGRVFAEFRLDDALLATARDVTRRGEKFEPVLNVNVMNEAGEVVAEVVKTLYVRRMDVPPAPKHNVTQDPREKTTC
jgi:acyl-coenzyme A thioesterase PaaI-like protein